MHAINEISAHESIFSQGECSQYRFQFANTTPTAFVRFLERGVRRCQPLVLFPVEDMQTTVSVDGFSAVKKTILCSLTLPSLTWNFRRLVRMTVLQCMTDLTRSPLKLQSCADDLLFLLPSNPRGMSCMFD